MILKYIAAITYLLLLSSANASTFICPEVLSVKEVLLSNYPDWQVKTRRGNILRGFVVLKNGKNIGLMRPSEVSAGLEYIFRDTDMPVMRCDYSGTNFTLERPLGLVSNCIAPRGKRLSPPNRLVCK